MPPEVQIYYLFARISKLWPHCHSAAPSHSMQRPMMAMLLAKLQKVTKAAACAWSKWSVCFVLMGCSSRSL